MMMRKTLLIVVVAICVTVAASAGTEQRQDVVRATSIARLFQNSICDACIKGFTDLKTQFTDAKQIEQLKNSMDSFCKRLIVVPLRDACSAYLFAQVDDIVNFFKQLDPVGYCHDLHFC